MTEVNEQIIEDVWRFAFMKKYLGRRRMKTIFKILIDKCGETYKPYKEFPLTYQEDYSKRRNNEIFITEYYELLKSSSNDFRLTVYIYNEGKRCEERFCVFDLNLNLRYDSVDIEACSIYLNEYKQAFIEKRDTLQKLFTKDNHE